ncbi:fimbrial protein [Citrobacter europaeus]|uniref:fimbrial protein n=1 Tax=Citrobacter europaeus TaxID=1914243 RepID=UPI0039C2F667
MHFLKGWAACVALKKLNLLWLIASAFYAVSSCADDGTGISLKGVVKDNTCTFDAGQTVVLDPVVRQNFSGKGSVLGIKPVTVKLKSCGTGAGKVDITVSGSVAIEDEYAFANTSTGDGSATGVGLYFYPSEGSTLFRPDGTVTQSVTTLTPSSDNILTFRAGYVALTAGAMAGSFGTVVNVALSYN